MRKFREPSFEALISTTDACLQFGLAMAAVLGWLLAMLRTNSDWRKLEKTLEISSVSAISADLRVRLK